MGTERSLVAVVAAALMIAVMAMAWSSRWQRRGSPSPSEAVTNVVTATTGQGTVARAQASRGPVVNDPRVPKARQVLLANRRIAVASGRSFPKRFCATQSPTVRGTAPYVVISELPVSRDVRIRAVADGARVIGFLPNNALLVEVDAVALTNLEENVLFMAAVEYEPTDKVQRKLQTKDGGMVAATVELLNPKDLATVRRFIADNGGKILEDGASSDKAIHVQMPWDLVGRLAAMAEVRWIHEGS